MSDKDLYVDTTREELIESLHLDYVIGDYEGDKLVGIATFIDARNTSRNLGKKFGGKPNKMMIVIVSVISIAF